jgi:P27 family predicted phage terminase small subunit
MALGRKPTPTAILKLRGSQHVKKRGREPAADGLTPECPDWLNDLARACWERLVPMLLAMRVLSRIDQNALARYCTTWARWREAIDFIQKNGSVYTLKDDDGKAKCLMQFPHVGIANKLGLELGRLEAEFGLTPSARTRLETIPLPSGGHEKSKSRFFPDGAAFKIGS